MNIRASIAAIASTLAFLPSLAAAQDQPWLKDRRYTEGIGIRVGDVELHPGIAGEFGYDSNYFHRAGEGDEDTVGALRLRITPSFSISTLGRQRTEVTPDAPPPDFEFRGGIAATYDEFWNASQVQLRREGSIPNYLRMLWGKKIVEWSATPEEALETMTELNNKYALDGRNPNSYSGILWCLGRYDRAWGPERPIFGKVRYMSSESARRKFAFGDYIARYGAAER